MARSGRAVLYIPDDGVGEGAVMARTTHLAISAHQDDIEFMAYAPIVACFGQADNRFCGSFFVAAPDLLSCRRSCSERSGELCGVAASPVRGSGEWFESAQKSG